MWFLSVMEGLRAGVSKAFRTTFHASFVQKITECVSSENGLWTRFPVESPAGQGSSMLLSYSRR
jgi:hypothetical protein